MLPATPHFAFGPRNYRLMWAGLAVLGLGFITMMLDRADYGEGTLGLIVGPLLLVTGFGLEFAAILVRSQPGMEALVGAPAEPAAAAVALPAPAPTLTAPPVLPMPTPKPSRPGYKRT